MDMQAAGTTGSDLCLFTINRCTQREMLERSSQMGELLQLQREG